MNGGSLGQRSGSYGSLQSPSMSALVRKQPREKERRLGWLCWIAGRRKLAMLLLFLISAAVVSFLSIVSRDEDTSAGHESFLEFTNQVRNFVTLPTDPVEESGHYSIGPPALILPSGTLDVTSVHPSIVSTRHPCESFSIPSPPLFDVTRTGPRPCSVCYVPVELAVELMPRSPSISPVLKNLTYVVEDNLSPVESRKGSIFGGYPSLLQRSESFDIKESMTVHCGFVKGQKPGQGTGFDIDESDLLEMEGCHGVVVASAIFGNYDIIQQPKNISPYAQKNACFYIFIDEETEAYMKNSSILSDSKIIGLWRVVVVQNLPYVDARRNGKIPKLLLHRLFPNARYSVWVDGKLELVVDPYLILERFLWRSNSTLAISRHYRRFDVFEEAEANKAAGKYVNASIDEQIEFYKQEGLTHYSPAKLPITSDVPEGCVIVKEHIAITNLFTCLWFNEVDRFTSRDQLSFSTVRDKIMSRVNWTINMFMDCERRNFVVQAYHRDLLEQKLLLALRTPPPHVVRTNRLARPPSSPKLPRKVYTRRGKDRKSGSKRRRPKTIERDNF